MKIVAGIQLYEEEDFVKPTLLSLLQFCDKIVVVEGCWEIHCHIQIVKEAEIKL